MGLKAIKEVELDSFCTDSDWDEFADQMEKNTLFNVIPTTLRDIRKSRRQ
jgi:hypothetical protein